MRPEKKKPGRFSDERPEPDDQMAGSEGGDLDVPRFREPQPLDPREEVKKRASRYVMEDPEEAERRRGQEENPEEGMGNESRPHEQEPIPEEKDVPDKEDEPGTDQEDEAWDRIDRDH